MAGEVKARLAATVSAFSVRYSSYASSSGALVQLWVPQQGEDGAAFLTTQGMPYAITGCSDLLSLYKYVSGRYRPPTDGSDPGCSIGRVFAEHKPVLSGTASSKPALFDRAAEATRCNIHSNLLLAIYDEQLEAAMPAAVFELAQHEVDVEFGHAVAILADVAHDHGFWVPQLETALNVDTCEVPLQPLADTISSSHSSMNATMQQTVRCCTPTPPAHSAAASAAAVAGSGARRRGRAMRRSSCMIADPPPLSPEDPGRATPSPEQLEQQPWSQGRPPRQRRQSVIVTDYYNYDTASGLPKSRTRRASDSGDLPGLPATAELIAQADDAPLRRNSMDVAAAAGYSRFPEPRPWQRQSSDLGDAAGGGVGGGGSSSRLQRSASPQAEWHSMYASSNGSISRPDVPSPDAPRPSRFGSSAGGLEPHQQQPQQWPHTPSLPHHHPHQQQHHQQQLQPQQWAQHSQAPSISSSSSSVSRLSPFQCGALPAGPQRSVTPTHHAHRHIVDASHNRRANSLQVRAVLHNAASQPLPQAPAHLLELQQQQQPPPDAWLQQDLTMHLQQQEQQRQACAFTRSQSSDDLQGWQPLQQQQQQQQAEACRLQSTSSIEHSTVIGSSSIYGSGISLSSRPPSLDVRPPSFDLSSAGSEAVPAGRDSRVRALVTHGGSFRHVGLGGMHEYVGGAQKLQVLPRNAGWHELQAALCSKLDPALMHRQVKLKYALPGQGSGPALYVDLDSQDDVDNMWEEYDDFISDNRGAKLQLYVEVAAGSSAGGSGASSCRNSAGSDTSKAFMAIVPQLTSAGSSQLQPHTPSCGAGPDAVAAAGVAAQVASMNLLPADGGASAAGAAAAAASAAASPAAAAEEVSFVPMTFGHLDSSAAQAGGAGDMRPALPQTGPLPALPQATETDELFVTCLDSIALDNDALQGSEGAGGARAVGTLGSPSSLTGRGGGASSLGPQGTNQVPAAAAAAAAATDRFGSAASSTASSNHSNSMLVLPADGGGASQQQPRQSEPLDVVMRRQRDQLKELVSELKGRMEIIMPMELNIVRYLGGGAFGEVYLARWFGTEVAVKCLSPSLLTTDHNSSGAPCTDAVAELMREAGMLASLHHPNIVSVFGIVLPPHELLTTLTDNDTTLLTAGSGNGSGCAADGGSGRSSFEYDEACSSGGGGGGGCSSSSSSARLGLSDPLLGRSSALSQGHPPAPAVVTEFLSVGSLRSAISNKAEWLRSSMAKVKLLLDTARGVDYLHSKRLVHFDLKSANLLVTMKDKVPCCKVADFGLTKQRRQTFVTGVNSLRGTLPWIAPEIVKNPAAVNEKADIYSFGVIMWELWTGQEPFEDLHLHALLHQLASPAGLSLAVPGTPEWGDEDCPAEPAPEWAALMRRCWLPPEQRPTSRELVGALDKMMEVLRMRRRSGPSDPPRQQQQQDGQAVGPSCG